MLGLRGRLTAALLAVSALALAIAAFSLLVPLDALLRHDALRSLAAEARTAKGRFAALPRAEIRPGSPALQRASRRLRRQTSAEVVVVGAPGRLLVATDADDSRRLGDVRRAIREHRLVTGTAAIGEAGQAQAAVPLEAHGRRFGLGLRKSLEDLGAARAVVERAVLVAALIALGGAVLAAAVLARRLVRRLAALRDTSLRVAELGPLAEMQDDGTRDEVGDLTRAFAMMQQRLRAQEQARRTFVATASHELRTPLASLRLMLHSASEELEAPHPDLQDTREQLGRALSQTERLSRLAADLLDLSRIDAGVPLRSERVELVELARSVIAEFEPRSAAGPDIRLDSPECRWATADPGSAARILRIVLDNALRHAPPAEPIEVEAGTVGGQAALTVTDAGPGVAPEDAERIFERFERGAGAGGDGGFGLGLAIGRELARRMGGDLVLAPGGAGARLRLTLPAAVVPAEEEAVAPHA
jgi:signal transduction histidine kinase